MKRCLALPAAAAALGIIALAPHAARAGEQPWCAVYASDFGGATEDCRFRTFEQCRPEVIAGNRGVCQQNPRWPGWWQQPRRGRR
jgi:hypothetical protein